MVQYSYSLCVCVSVYKNQCEGIDFTEFFYPISYPSESLLSIANVNCLENNYFCNNKSNIFFQSILIAGSDYNSTEGVYNLTGRETVTVNIGIIEDDKFEHAEEFYASLSFVVVPPRVILQPDRTEINIIDTASELIQSPHTTIIIISAISYKSHILFVAS